MRLRMPDQKGTECRRRCARRLLLSVRTCVERGDLWMLVSVWTRIRNSLHFCGADVNCADRQRF